MTNDRRPCDRGLLSIPFVHYLRRRDKRRGLMPV
jgi:hypothetical protein